MVKKNLINKLEGAWGSKVIINFKISEKGERNPQRSSRALLVTVSKE
ncbi:MAG: hypothetical protein ACRD5B_13470 [Nitrososphaeraceae archaeon]